MEVNRSEGKYDVEEVSGSESEITSVTINQSSIGGSAAQPMAQIGDTNVWQEGVSGVNGDGSVDFADVTYLGNHVVGTLGYEILK